MKPKKIISTQRVRESSDFIGAGEQGEVRVLRKKYFGERGKEVVKIIHHTALKRPHTFFNTHLIESRELDSKKRVRIAQAVHNMANALFPNNVVRIPLARYPKRIGHYQRNLEELNKDEILPELYMPKVEDPPDIVELKRELYKKIRDIQERSEYTDFEGRKALIVEMQSVRREFDGEVGKRYPQIYELEKSIEAAGFDIQHPEINFGIRNSQIVFYDMLPRIDVNRLMQYIHTNQQVSERQRKEITRKLQSLSRLRLSATDLWDRRKTFFLSLTSKGASVIKRITRKSRLPSSGKELHETFRETIIEDLFRNNALRRDIANRILQGISRNETVNVNGRQYSARVLGNKAIIYPTVPEEMFTEMITTDIGLMALEIPILRGLGQGMTIADFSNAKLIVVDVDYLIRNNLADMQSIKILFT